MLKTDALNQLKQLKSDIKASRNLELGRVKGTAQKFGFVTLDSGRDVFLPPNEMLRVLPNDRVEVELLKDDKNKSFARIERLIESSNKEFFGKYVAKGPAHFAEADFDGSTRWIFIPPNKRGKAKPGDLLKCKLVQHPIKNGKPQAHISSILGHEGAPGIEWVYGLAKHRISERWSDKAEAELADINESAIESLFEGRTDCTALPFFTIDGESTTDMDDALAIEKTEQGWVLKVAVADPEALLNQYPALEGEIIDRGASLYSPGKIVAMMPQKLSSDLCSLVEGKKRLARVFTLSIKHDGELDSIEYVSAVVRSAKKLSYAQASKLADAELAPEIVTQLEQLRSLAESRLAWRKGHACLQQSRPEFFIELDDKKKISAIKPREVDMARAWIEECMLLVNAAVANLLAGNGASSLYIGHKGVRTDRLETMQALADKASDNGWKLNTPQGFSRFINAELDDEHTYLKALLVRQLERTDYVTKQEPHFGLGFTQYTTVTSPLRKANDYLVHKHLRMLESGNDQFALEKSMIKKLGERQESIRSAVLDIEQALKCEFISRQTGSFEAEVIRVFTTGIQVRLVDTGVEGAILTRDIDGKCSFNQERMEMKTPVGQFKLMQSVRVELKRVDWSKKQAQFVPVS